MQEPCGTASAPKKQQDACVFCDIVAGRAPARIVEEDARSLCLLDIQPLAKGHCLVVPKRHVPFWYELSEEETASLFRVARTVARRMTDRLGADFICLYSRGRRIPHTHIFLLPTFGGAMLDRFFNALEGFQESVPGLAALREQASFDELWAVLKE